MKRVKRNNKKSNFKLPVIGVILTVIIVLILLLLLVLNKNETSNKFIHSLGIFYQKLNGEIIDVDYSGSNREKLNFNYGWIFSKGEGKNNSLSNIPEEIVSIIPNSSSILPYSFDYAITNENLGLNNEVWQNVSLPHTYNDIDTFNNYMESGENGERSMYSGTAWYKKEFFIPENYNGKRIYIEFEAARQAAKIYLNGELIEGTCENGFIPFGYDLTPKIRYGQNNYITVMVDNSFKYYMEEYPSSGLSWNDSHWNPNYGGLYRDCNLYVMDDLHFTLPLYSFLETQGTYIYTSEETATTAKINVEAEVENSTADTKKFKVIAYVKDMEGYARLRLETGTMTLATNEKNVAKVNGVLNDAKRWSTEYPYLYTVECKLIEIIDEDPENIIENIVDNNETKMGIRTFRFTNDYGVFLNENYIKLTGWGQKSTNEWAALGAAYPDWMQDYVLKLMKDAGSNFIRWGHTAGSPVQVSSADKYGIITLQPGVDGEGTTASGYYDTNSYNSRISAFRDLIIYFRNSPSILLWEVGNQKIPTWVAEQMISYIQTYDHGNRIYTIENEQGVTTYNSTEKKTNASSYNTAIASSRRVRALRRLDDTSLVKYFDVGITTQGTGIVGNLPLVEGEYNRYEARRGVWDKFTEGFTDFSNSIATSTANEYKTMTSETFAISQITQYESDISAISHGGGANWIFSDTISHGRVFSEVARASGEVDAMMLPKESYWVTKILFNDETASHIIGHWNYPAGTVKNVYAIAKANGMKSAELIVTDENGATTMYSGVLNNNYLWTFTDVIYESGSVEVKVKDQNGTVLTSDSITSHGLPTQLKITKVENTQSNLLANGSDVLLLDVELLDENGNRCESYDGQVENSYTYFTLNNQASNVNSDEYCIWKGGYNSGLENSTQKKQLYLEAGITRVAIKTTMTPGTISLTANTTVKDSQNNDLNLTSNTYSISTIAVDNTNGYTSTQENRLGYDISSLNYLAPGNGTKPLQIVTESGQVEPEVFTSNLVENISYTGSNITPISLELVLEKGAQIYCDSSAELFSSVPYRYLNAEYLQLPSSDNGMLAGDLTNFTVKKDLDVLIFRDIRVTNTPWLNDFLDTGDIVTSNTGTVYKIYKKSVTTGSGINLGSNGQTAQEGSKGAMYVVAFKETSKVENSIFFEDDFSTGSLGEWYVKPNENNLNIVEETYDNLNTVHIIDNAQPGFTYLYRRFAKIDTNLKFNYRYLLSTTLYDSEIVNKYIRGWLNQEQFSNNINSKSNILYETYITDNNKFTYRTSNSVTGNIKTNMPVNNWNDVEYITDNHLQNMTVNVNSSQAATNVPYYGNNLSYVNHMGFFTGNNSSNNFYIDNVKIEPILPDVITDIKINNISIANFNVLTNDYLKEILEDDEEYISVEFITGSEYSSGEYEISSDGNKISIAIHDIYENVYLYNIYLINNFINKTELKSVVSMSNGLKSQYYQENEWNNLRERISNAETLINNRFVNKIQIDEMLVLLRNNVRALKIK